MRIPPALLSLLLAVLGPALASAQSRLAGEAHGEAAAFATPVRLSGHAGGVELSWTASLEAPVAYYSVFRVADGREILVATFTPQPAERERANYRLIDQGPWRADLAFRVAATYADGRVASTPLADVTRLYDSPRRTVAVDDLQASPLLPRAGAPEARGVAVEGLAGVLAAAESDLR